MQEKPGKYDFGSEGAEAGELTEAILSSSTKRPTLNVAEVKKLETKIAGRGTSLSVLMERAGCALALAAKKAARTLDLKASPRIAVLCGAGNNGGDGWVAARKLASDGCSVVLISHRDASELAAEPAKEQAQLTEREAAGLPTLEIRIAPENEAVREVLETADIAIDAMLGTGFSGTALREPYAAWTNILNEAHKAGLFVIAADAPSGLCAQTGRAASPCVKAHETITMITSKPGLETPYAFAFCGDVFVASLAFAEDLIEDVVRERDAKANGEIKPTAHKQAREKSDPFRRAENEDDDGYDPYSDRPPTPTPLFEADPWN